MKVGGEVAPETLEPFGIPTYELTESCIHIGPKAKSSMDDMYADILNLGRIFGVEAKAEELVAGWMARRTLIAACLCAYSSFKVARKRPSRLVPTPCRPH